MAQLRSKFDEEVAKAGSGGGDGEDGEDGGDCGDGGCAVGQATIGPPGRLNVAHTAILLYKYTNERNQIQRIVQSRIKVGGRCTGKSTDSTNKIKVAVEAPRSSTPLGV